MKYLIIIILAASVLLSGCMKKPINKATNVSPTTDYNPSARALHPEFKAYHESNGRTKLYFKLSVSEIFYLKVDTKEQAQLTAHYEILSSTDNPVLIDSAYTRFTIPKVAKQSEIVAFIDIKATDSLRFWLKVKLEDRYSRKTSTTYIKIDKNTTDHSQNFLSLNYATKKPYFLDYMTDSDSVIIQNNTRILKKLYVKYYDRNFSVPMPPFSELHQTQSKISPDSVYEILCQNGAAIFYPKKSGLYRIQTDTTANLGVTKVIFNKNYPYFKTSADLLQAVQYISTDNEFMLMAQSANKKLAVDNFWLRASNDTERARELVKVWYNRATYANIYFTSYKEGWKTDRGMIYMVFGPPQIVERSETGERWTYTEKSDYQPIHFIFKQNDSRVSEQDLVLMRDNSYQTFWYEAVETWRQGSVYQYSP